jgi:hypothetical protein
MKWGRQRAVQYVARESRKRANEGRAATEANSKNAATAHTELTTHTDDPLEVVARRDIYEHVHRFYDTMPEPVKADVSQLFSASLVEVAKQLGISKSAVAQRRAVLRRRIHALAIEAGILEPDGTYDGATTEGQ